MQTRHQGPFGTNSLLQSDTSTYRRTNSFRLSWLLIVLTLFASNGGLALAADSPDEDAAPPQFQAGDEFILPEGDIRPGNGRKVFLKSSDSRKLTVGRIFVEGDKRYLVTMPDGSLVSVTKDEVSITDRPFVVKSAEAMEKSLLSGRFEGFKSKRTKRYLYIYDCSDAYFKAANMILETMHPKILNFCKNLDLDLQECEFPLVVIMFGDRQSFDEYKALPRGVAAYYSFVSNFIVMYDDPVLSEYAPQYALKSSVSTIAHEGVHQILGNVGIQRRFARWPMWIQEGLPEYCAPTESGKRVRWRGLGRVNHLRMRELILYREYAKKKGGRKKQWFDLKEVVEAKGLTSLGYAHGWGMVYGLAKSRKTKDQFAALLRDVSKLGPLEEPPEPGYYFRKHFGKDYKANAEHVVKELNKARKKYVDPIENQTYFVAVIETRRSYYTRVSPSVSMLRKWAKKASRDGVQGTFRIEAFASRKQALVARDNFLRKNR